MYAWLLICGVKPRAAAGSGCLCPTIGMPATNAGRVAGVTFAAANCGGGGIAGGWLLPTPGPPFP